MGACAELLEMPFYQIKWGLWPGSEVGPPVLLPLTDPSSWGPGTSSHAAPEPPDSPARSLQVGATQRRVQRSWGGREGSGSPLLETCSEETVLAREAEPAVAGHQGQQPKASSPHVGPEPELGWREHWRGQLRLQESRGAGDTPTTWHAAQPQAASWAGGCQHRK